MTQRNPTTRRSRPALVAVAAVLLGAGWYGWTVFRPAARIGKVRNVLLISIDTCRADHLGCYGAKRPPTPHIDALAREGVLFEDALSPVPLTTPAHSSMMTGTYPPTHGVRLNNGEALAASNVTLAEVLKDAGYRTGAFVGGFPLDPGFGLSQGFETYDARFTKKSETSTTVAERTAPEVAAPAVAWLEQHAREPFFLFVHFFDAHLPYQPPPELASAFADDPYSGELAYVDASIGRLLDRLRELKADGDTLVVITADHGESLNEHGESSHGYFIYQSTQRVPLVMRAPGGPKGRRRPERVSLIDLMPTILDLTGVKTPPRVEGSSLRAALEGGRPPERERALYVESLVATQFRCAPLNALVEGRWKYIRAPKPELYDLTKDGGERNNIVSVEPAIAQRLRERLDATLEGLEAGASAGAAAAPDPDAVQRLQSLGYVGGGATPARSALSADREDPKDFIATYERLEHANGLFHSNRSAEAERELLSIVLSHPNLVAAEDQLAQIARRDGRPGDEVKHYARIVAIHEASNDRPLLPAAYFNLAFALREAGRDGEAIASYERALAIDPDYVEAHNSLGVTLAGRGRLDEAIVQFEHVLKAKPDHAQAHNNLGSALERQGKTAAAIEQYTRAIAIKPDYPAALSHLAWIRATNADPKLRNGAEAVELAASACAISRRAVPGYLDTLAAAYAESSRFDQAVATAEEAAAAARASGDAGTAAQIDVRLAGYRRGRPYRASGR
jgi:arylsulfatase A-like enzyme/Flp pilus assembly protein TadD